MTPDATDGFLDLPGSPRPRIESRLAVLGILTHRGGS